MKKVISILSIALFLVSCGTAPKETSTENQETIDKAIYQKWELSLLEDMPAQGNKVVYLELTEDNKVSGFIGCNTLNGNYTIENGSQIKFTELGTTKMMCPEDEMETEKQVLALLNTVDNFTLSDGKLMLNVGKRAPLATFHVMNDNEIVNKYWKLKTLEGKEVKMAENQEEEVYFMLRGDGSMNGFAGCNHFNGSYELAEGMRLSFNENMAMTMKACPDMDLNESALMEVFGLTDNYTINGDTLSLNVAKRAPLAVFEAVYF